MRFIPNILAFCFIVASSHCAETLNVGGDGQKEIGRTTEKSLKVVLSSSFGNVTVGKGEPEKIIVANTPADNPRMSISYSIRDRVGYADIVLGDDDPDGAPRKKGSVHITKFDRGAWELKFTDAIPISFDVELGVGKGRFDMSGLQTKDFNLSTGASEVVLSFDEANRTTIDNINIESGVSRFEGRNLCNANFKRFKFQGGVGSYTLDFGGELKREVDVDVEVGLGAVTIIIPKSIGVKLFYDKNWLTRFEYAKDFNTTNDTQYVTDNYSSATGRMNIRIDSGLGSVKIRRE
jgi:hypothetical protein